MVKLLPFYLHCVPLEGYTPYIMVCILFHLSTLTNLFLLFYASDACTSFGKTSSRKPLNTGCLSELMRLGIYSTTHTWFVFTQITSCSPIGIKRNGFLPVTSKVSIASFVTPDVTYPLKISVLPLYFARTRLYICPPFLIYPATTKSSSAIRLNLIQSFVRFPIR